MFSGMKWCNIFGKGFQNIVKNAMYVIDWFGTKVELEKHITLKHDVTESVLFCEAQVHKSHTASGETKDDIRTFSINRAEIRRKTSNGRKTGHEICHIFQLILDDIS